jgi:alkylhydroperoxidase/carboxymuconolactone decarboxylase family protein YurZ
MHWMEDRVSDSAPSETVAGTPQHAFKEYEWLAQIDPSYDKARRDLAALVWAPAAPSLAVKYREIIAVVILGCRAYPTIESHLRRALAEGATLREVLEGFETAAILGGFPALHYALPFLSALHEEFGDAILDARMARATFARTRDRPETPVPQPPRPSPVACASGRGSTQSIRPMTRRAAT